MEQRKVIASKFAIFSSPNKSKPVIDGNEHFYRSLAVNSLSELLESNHFFYRFRRVQIEKDDEVSNEEEDSEDIEDVFEDNDRNRSPVTDPNYFYYHYLAAGQEPRSGPWTQNERRLFMQRAMQRGVNYKWGIFSKSIPRRFGYRCSERWRGLIKAQYVKDLNFKDVNGRMRIPRHHNVPKHIRRYSFIVFDAAWNTLPNIPCYHPKFPSDNELLHHLNYIPVYIAYIDSFTETQHNFCEYLEECNDLILPDIAETIHGYVAEQKQIGWITDWAADILAPLIYQNKIKICIHPKSIKLNQLMIKRIGNEWPSELDKYCDKYQCDDI